MKVWWKAAAKWEEIQEILHPYQLLFIVWGHKWIRRGSGKVEQGWLLFHELMESVMLLQDQPWAWIAAWGDVSCSSLCFHRCCVVDPSFLNFCLLLKLACWNPFPADKVFLWRKPLFMQVLWWELSSTQGGSCAVWWTPPTQEVRYGEQTGL